jgi:hypothetical protein
VPRDAAAWAALTAEAETVDKTGENYDADDLAEELDDPLVDLEHGTVAGWDGEVLAAVGVLRHADPANRAAGFEVQSRHARYVCAR